MKDHTTLAPPKKKVLWLIKGLGLGGAEMLFPIAIPYLDHDTFEYEVGFLLPWKNALVPRIEEKGICVTCFNETRRGDPRIIMRLARFVRERNIDLIHAHLPHTGILARLVGRMTGRKVIYTEHNQWGRLNPVMRAANWTTFGLNHWSIAVSREVAESMRHVSRRNLSVIDNGVDVGRLLAEPDNNAGVRAEFGIPGGDFLIGKVANLTPKKNHENLIDAFAHVHKSHPASTLLLVGQLAGRDALLRRRAESLGVMDKVVFAGARTDVARIVKAFDVFAISSDFEGLPVAMLEAMALGRPVVATAVGGIPGVLEEGRYGLLVPPASPEQLAEALLRIQSDPALRSRLAVDGQSCVQKRFDISRMVQCVETIYRDVLAQGEHRAHH